MKVFYQILTNTVIATITNMTVWFGITFYIFLQTRSVFATSMLSGIYLIAVAATGIWFGGLVDHHKKKTMMIVSSIVSFIAFSICFGIYILTDKAAFADPTNITLWILTVLILLGVLVGNIRTIALPTLVTLLVPEDQRARANGLSGTATGVAFLITSVISGFLVGQSGMFMILLLSVITTGIAIVHLWFVDIPEKVESHEDQAPKKVDIKGTIKVIQGVPGLMALIFFATFNNFLGGVFMSLMDAYGLSLVSVEVWGLLWGFISVAFIVGGIVIAKVGVGKNPLKTLFLTNIFTWTICCLFTIQPSIIILTIGMFLYLSVMPFIEASEQTLLQKVVPYERQGRVFGFAQSVEQTASPIMAFAIGPIAQFIFIPFMTTGAGVDLIGGWFGTGTGRGIALVFIIAGILGLCLTIFAMRSKQYKQLSNSYLTAVANTPKDDDKDNASIAVHP